MEQPSIQRVGFRDTSLGSALYIKIYTPNYRKLSWREIWDCFSETFPGQWAIECFPSADALLDEENIYHLFVLDTPPKGLDIRK